MPSAIVATAVVLLALLVPTAASASEKPQWMPEAQLVAESVAPAVASGVTPTEFKAQYEAFLGEGFRRRFGGSWVELEPEMLGNVFENAPLGLGIKYPESDAIDVVSSLVPFAYRVGTGTWWSSSFQVTESLLDLR